MRFTADENLERSIVEGLREMGHDVFEASVESPRAPDPLVLERSAREDRILITNDKDFAELAFLQRKATAGIVLVRLPKLRTRQKTKRVLEVIDQQGERLRNVFTVVEAHAIRKRPFLFIERHSSKA